MGCYNNCGNACTAGAMNACPTGNKSCVGGFGRVINVIVILIVLQFLTQLLCDTSCDIC